jgi:hypothetical protein
VILVRFEILFMLQAFFSVRSAALLLFCLAGGCSGEAALPMRGTVTLDGERVAQGNIVFLPQASSGPKAAAAIENGVYSIPAEQGLLPGKYRVEVSWHKPTGRKIASADPGMTIDETREAIPAKFNTDSTLTVDIDGSDKPYDFVLTSK